MKMSELLRKVRDALGEDFELCPSTSDEDDDGIEIIVGRAERKYNLFDVAITLGRYVPREGYPRLIEQGLDAISRPTVTIHAHRKEHQVGKWFEIYPTGEHTYRGPDVPAELFVPSLLGLTGQRELPTRDYTLDEVLSLVDGLANTPPTSLIGPYQRDRRLLQLHASDPSIETMVHILEESSTLREVRDKLGSPDTRNSLGLLHQSPLSVTQLGALCEIHLRRQEKQHKVLSVLRAYYTLKRGILEQGERWAIPYLDKPVHSLGREFHSTGRYYLEDLSPEHFAGLIIEDDCNLPFSRTLPAMEIKTRDVYYKVIPDAVSDPFLRSLGRHARDMRKDIKSIIHYGRTIKTETHVIEGEGRRYFMKRIVPWKVPSSDYELEVASQLLRRGIDIQPPVGVAVINRIPYVLFEHADNAVNLMGHDSSQELNIELDRALDEQEKQVYTALGCYIKTLFDSGVYDRDMAKRNFMAQFDDKHRFRRVFMVDFEKTTLGDGPLIDAEKKDGALRELEKFMSRSERRYFKKGYYNK